MKGRRYSIKTRYAGRELLELHVKVRKGGEPAYFTKASAGFVQAIE
jgi:hypothetical protein